MPDWTPEEIEYEEINGQRYPAKYGGKYIRRQEKPYRNVEHPQHYKQQYQDVGSFVMYFHYRYRSVDWFYKLRRSGVMPNRLVNYLSPQRERIRSHGIIKAFQL